MNSIENLKACIQGKHAKIIFTKQIGIPEKPPAFIMGFPGVGMIGTIVAHQLIEKIEDIEKIGYIVSEDLPPIAIFYDGELKQPFRIYYSKKTNLIISICEVPFQNDSYSDLTRTLLDWAMGMKVKEVVTMSGIETQTIPLMMSQDYIVYGAAEQSAMERLRNIGVEKLKRGLIVGFEAAILNECLNNRLDGILLLVETHMQIPSPEAAVAIIKTLQTLYGFEIDSSDLIEKGNEIRKKLMELANKTQQMSQMDSNRQIGSGTGHTFYS